MKRLIIAFVILLLAGDLYAMQPPRRGVEPESLTLSAEVQADSGFIGDCQLMDWGIRWAKMYGYYTTIAYSGDANVVKKDSANAVSKVYDKGPSKNHLLQATGAAQALWVANAQNGRAGLTFDGTNTFYNFAFAPLAAGAPAMALVAALKTNVNTAASHVLFYQGTVTNVQYKAYMPALYNNTMYFSNTNNDRETAAGTVANNTNYILEWCYDGAAAFSASQPSFYRNGASLSSTQGTGTGTPDITQNVAYIGSGSEFPNRYKGSMFAGVLLYPRSAALTAFLNAVFAIY